MQIHTLRSMLRKAQTDLGLRDYLVGYVIEHAEEIYEQIGGRSKDRPGILPTLQHPDTDTLGELLRTLDRLNREGKEAAKSKAADLVSDACRAYVRERTAYTFRVVCEAARRGDVQVLLRGGGVIQAARCMGMIDMLPHAEVDATRDHEVRIYSVRPRARYRLMTHTPYLSIRSVDLWSGDPAAW